MKMLAIDKHISEKIKVWGAIITGLDEKYGLKRVFKSYRHLNDCSSRIVYYNYYIDVEENEIVEIGIKSSYKNKRYYYKLKNEEFISISIDDILKYFSGEIIWVIG